MFELSKRSQKFFLPAERRATAQHRSTPNFYQVMSLSPRALALAFDRMGAMWPRNAVQMLPWPSIPFNADPELLIFTRFERK